MNQQNPDMSPESPAPQTPDQVSVPEANTPAKSAAKSPAPKAEKKDDAPPQSFKGLDAVVHRNNFYRDGYRTLKLAVFVQAIAVLMLGGVIFYMANKENVKYVYFASTEDGRLVKMSPLSEPNLSTPALMSWTAQAVAQTMTFGFHDYRKRLQESSRFFTRPGWAKFTEALEKSSIMTTVEANQQVVTAAPRSAPVVIQEGMVNGRYEWLVEIPMNITYKAGSKIRSDAPTVRLKIVRVSKLENAHGVGIEQWLQ